MAKPEDIYFDREDVIKAFNYIEKYGAPKGFNLQGRDYNISYNGLEYCVKALFKVIAGDRIDGDFYSTPELRARFNMPPDIKVVPKKKTAEETPIRTNPKAYVIKKDKKMPQNKTYEELINKNDYSSKAEELLKKFIEYDKNYDDSIGIYAIYLKNKDLKLTKCQKTVEEYIEKSKNSLFYIGVTGKGKNSRFKKRLIKGHVQGKHHTSFNSNLLKGLGYKIDKDNKFNQQKERFLKDINMSWEAWFKNYFEYKILPLDKKSTAEFVEALLIYVYQPPFNTEGCDSVPF